MSSGAFAKPGTHPIVVSTWDPRASSVVVGYRHGFSKGGGFNDVSYNANFSSTSGVLSAQFGLHYESYSPNHSDPTAQGLAGTAAAVFNLPLTSRLDNGLAKVALDFYVGAAPTALISGELNYLSFPAVLGAGVSTTPFKYLTLTPWFELSPGVNLDTEVKPYQLSQSDVAGAFNPATGQVNLTQSQVENIVSKSVNLKTSVSAGARAGLDLALHLSDYVDLGADLAVSSAGTAFKGPTVVYLGAAFVWRWDEIVPAVLPAEKRLLHEDCDAIEARFRMCPNSEHWTPPPATAPASQAAPAPLAPEPLPPVKPATPAPTTPTMPPPANFAPPPPPPPPGAAPPVGSNSFPQ
ncbi:MAG TPA: hypothetical protein VMI54_31015 [Polyangiaceae bacterium]|nr:hypothetical protein [Polyangiaceae bacterium]